MYAKDVCQSFKKNKSIPPQILTLREPNDELHFPSIISHLTGLLMDDSLNCCRFIHGQVFFVVKQQWT